MIGFLKNINEEFDQDLKESLKDILYEPTKEETIDFFNKFVGRVVDNNDPDKYGRCKIRIFGLFGSEITDSDLPWATPDMEFIGSSKGSFIVPPIGSLVNIYFHKGDIYQPHYTTSCLDINHIPSRRMKKYPDNMVFFETDEGDYLELDRIIGTTNFQHRSGTKITIYNTGDVEIDCNGRNYTVKNADNVDIGGKSMTGVGGNFGLVYSTTGAIPTDSHGVPIQGVGVTTNTKGG